MFFPGSKNLLGTSVERSDSRGLSWRMISEPRAKINRSACFVLVVSASVGHRADKECHARQSNGKNAVRGAQAPMSKNCAEKNARTWRSAVRASAGVLQTRLDVSHLADFRVNSKIRMMSSRLIRRRAARCGVSSWGRMSVGI